MFVSGEVGGRCDGGARYKTHGNLTTLHDTNYHNWSPSRELSP